MNTHHESPHFLTVPSQLPGHDHDHCPTDVVLPVSIPRDEDHHDHEVPAVPVPRSSSTGSTSTMQPSAEDPDLLYPRRLWTPRTAYPDLVDQVRAIREKQHGETNPHMHRKPEQVKVVDPNRETNPHFYRNPPPAEDQDLRRPQPPRPGWLRHPRTEHPPRDPVLAVQVPEDQDHDRDKVLMTEVPKAPLQPRDSAAQPHQPRPYQQRNRRQTLEVPYVRQRRVHPCAACSAVIFCVFLTLAALAVFIIYLIFRPWGPRFEVSTVTTLNGLNLTTKGSLLSANLTLVTNFTNPNKKAGVDFKYIVVELYFGTTIIATKNIEPDLSAPKGGGRSVEVDMVASGVQLSEVENEIRRLKRQMVKDRVVFEAKVTFLVHTKFGHLVRYSYWMRGQCIFVLKKPPHGVLVSSRCNTKRHQKFV
ncbi:hypothetical protein TorRG33x02_053350 [Trema orientale]|uniref:Late embryogenesis abundant protein n=1 Tax=Trema orientale TaxID=63057 RepID=A0A2P5FMR8_TREOI|nr:hypothetical protein TorRG33x02_053350 [Trema orientale]